MCEGTNAGAGGPSRRQVGVALGVLAAIAVLYVASIPDVLIINPDSMHVLGLGRSLARGDGYTLNGEPYGKFPPVLPLLLAAVYGTVGESFWALQLVVALCGIGAGAMAFVLFRPRAGWWPALALGVLTGVCGWVQSHSLLVIRTDVPYLCFSLAALWLAGRAIRSARGGWRRWLPVAAATWLAIYTHLAGAALVPAIAAAALIARGQQRSVRQRLVGAAMVAAVCGSALGFWLWRGAQLQRAASYIAHVELLTGGHSHGTLFKLKLRLREWTATPLGHGYEDVALPAAIAAWALLLAPGYVRALVRHRGAPELYLPVFFVLSLVAGGPHGHERYAIPVVPLLLYYGYVSLRLWGRAIGGLFRSPGAARVLPRALVAIVGLYALWFNLHCRFAYRKALTKFSPSRLDRETRIVAAWREAAGWAERSVPKDARIYASSGGTWGVACYFLPRYVIQPLVHEMGPYAMQAMHERGAGFAVVDTLPRSKDRFEPIIWKYPGCFEQLGNNRKVQLYLVNRAALAETVKALKAAGKLKPITHPVRLFPTPKG